MTDAIASYTVGGQTYLVTANEGDAREYGTAYVEPLRLNASSYVLDSTVFTNAAALKANINRGRLNVTNASGDLDGDGDFDEIHVCGPGHFPFGTPPRVPLFGTVAMSWNKSRLTILNSALFLTPATINEIT
jgi:hypothetical protein